MINVVLVSTNVASDRSLTIIYCFGSLYRYKLSNNILKKEKETDRLLVYSVQLGLEILFEI